MKVKNTITNKEYEIYHYFIDARAELKYGYGEEKTLCFENHTTSDTATLKLNGKTIICEDIEFFEVLYEMLNNLKEQQ